MRPGMAVRLWALHLKGLLRVEMTITITKELDEMWATPEEFAQMSDQEIVDLCLEDQIAILDNATWSVDRA
jgi:hypothetical protein